MQCQIQSKDIKKCKNHHQLHPNCGSQPLASKAGVSYKTRIVTDSHFVNGESSQWRGDYFQYKGFTYARILKQTSKDNKKVTSVAPQVRVTPLSVEIQKYVRLKVKQTIQTPKHHQWLTMLYLRKSRYVFTSMSYHVK